MDLKKKVQEVKEYSELKNQLIQLIKNYLIEYEEYEKKYNGKFKKWVDKTVAEFTEIFKAAGFEVSIKESGYQHEQYKTIKATIDDLKFELLITVNDFDNIRFLQLKPELEKKNIVLKPTIKKYYLNEIHINNNRKDIKILNISSLDKQKDRVKDTEFSLEEINQFRLEIKREMDLLLCELQKLEAEQFRGEDAESSYGEFDNFSELIDRI